MPAQQTPAPYDNSFLGNTTTWALLQEIGSDDKWHTIGSCNDTPNAIKAELAKPEYQGHGVWIRTPFERRYHGTVK
jgi:hypothetical protein